MEPVAVELVELVNFEKDNVIYELPDPDQPLLNVLPSYDNFLTMLAMLPDYDHRELLLLTEMPRINARVRQSMSILCEYRLQQSFKKVQQPLIELRKNLPIGQTPEQLQSLISVEDP